MALVLSFDTSSAHCAAALLLGDDIIAERREEMGRGQAERLVPLLEEVLSAGGKDWRDLDGIATGIGPGNFTGIRISVALARGLALSLDRPAIGVSGFAALAHGHKGPVLASIAAPRGNIYVQQLDKGEPGKAELIAPAELPDHMRIAGVTCIGAQSGALAQAIGATSAAAPDNPASAMARIAVARLKQGGDIAPPAPLYLRSADAAPPRDAPPVIVDDA